MSITEDPVVRSAARWFWWIAGLSAVNSVLFHAGSDVNFVVGLGMATIASMMFAKVLPLAIVVTAGIVGFYVLMGWLAQQGRLWAFYLGLALYLVDAAIYVVFQDWMSVGFHALAAYFIIQGIRRVHALGRAGVPASA